MSENKETIECLALNNAFMLLCPQTRETLLKRGQKECKSEGGRENCKILSPGHDTAIANTNSQQQRLSAPGLNKSGLVSRQSWISDRLIGSYLSFQFIHCER